MGENSVHDIKMDNDEDGSEERITETRGTVKHKKMEEIENEKKCAEENVFVEGSFKPADGMLLASYPEV